MRKKLKEPFGKAGLIVAAIALIFALTGGALATTGNNPLASSSKAKQGKQGKPGKTGPAGPTGPAGAAGTNGTNGKYGAGGVQGVQGVPGTNGKTVLSGTATPGAGTGTDGDFYIETDVSKIYGPKAAGAWPAGVELKGPEGPEGSPWTDGGTLPPGETETGAWAYGAMNRTKGAIEGGEGSPINVTVSFPIPLETAIPHGGAHLIYTNGKEVIFSGTFEVEEVTSTSCHGTPEAPQADPGNFCMYARQMGPLGSFGSGLFVTSQQIFSPGSTETSPLGPESGKTGQTGARLQLVAFAGAEANEGWGTWAVTAP